MYRIALLLLFVLAAYDNYALDGKYTHAFQAMGQSIYHQFSGH